MGSAGLDGAAVVSVDGLQVAVLPGTAVRLEELPPRSIALDGVVQGPALDPESRRFSFDHHGGCVRLATSATCRQVADALLLGLDPSDCTVFVNDLDGDTVLAVALLTHPEWLSPGGKTMPLVRRLVEAVGARDAHGSAYPVLEPDLLALFANRVPLPFREIPPSSVPAELARCVQAVVALVGELSRQAEDGTDAGERDFPPAGRARTVDYTVTHVGTGWVMATSDDNALDQLYADGHLRAVMWRAQPDGSTAYTVARKSDLVSGFPVGPATRQGTILAALAAREPGWGGGTSIGGAPRHADGRRSSLPPDEVFALVEQVVEAHLRAGLSAPSRSAPC